MGRDKYSRPGARVRDWPDSGDAEEEFWVVCKPPRPSDIGHKQSLTEVANVLVRGRLRRSRVSEANDLSQLLGGVSTWAKMACEFFIFVIEKIAISIGV